MAALAAAVAGADEVVVPPNLIPDGASVITTEMVPLAGLSDAELERVVARVPGGAANVADVYPLAPLQEGILFHHLLARSDTGAGAGGAVASDAYVLPMVLGFDARERLEGFLATLRRVIGRHDILRSAVVWQGLREPVQVVVRQAPLPVHEVVLTAGQDAVTSLLAAGTDPLDPGSAPLLRVLTAMHPDNGDHWLTLLNIHHLVQTTPPSRYSWARSPPSSKDARKICPLRCPSATSWPRPGSVSQPPNTNSSSPIC